MAFFSYKRMLLLLLSYVALLFIGAAIMMYIESFAEDETKIEKQTNYTLIKEYLESKLNINVSHENATEIHSQLSSSNFTITFLKKGINWRKEISFKTFMHWKFFSEVSLSTIGYGNIVPITEWGKLFLVIFAAIGIPVHMLLITAIGFAVHDLMQFLRFHICKIFRKQHEAPSEDVYDIINMAVLSLLWLLIGAVVASDVMGWSFITGLYYAFVSFSTIGYGDYTIDAEKIKLFGEFVAWYTTIGLALAAGATNAICQVLAHKTLQRDGNGGNVEIEERAKTVGKRKKIDVRCRDDEPKSESEF